MRTFLTIIVVLLILIVAYAMRASAGGLGVSILGFFTFVVVMFIWSFLFSK